MRRRRRLVERQDLLPPLERACPSTELGLPRFCLAPKVVNGVRTHTHITHTYTTHARTHAHRRYSESPTSLSASRGFSLPPPAFTRSASQSQSFAPALANAADSEEGKAACTWRGVAKADGK